MRRDAVAQIDSEMTFLIISRPNQLFTIVLIHHLSIISATLTTVSYNSPQSIAWSVLVLMCIFTTALDSEGSSSSLYVDWHAVAKYDATRISVFPL